MCTPACGWICYRLSGGNNYFCKGRRTCTPRYSVIATTANPQDYENMQKKIKKIEKERKSSAAKYLKEVISRVKQGGTEYKADVLVGKVAERLVDYVEPNEIDLVLIATHGRSGISRWVRGSIADKVLRSSSAPVLMVRARRRDERKEGLKHLTCHSNYIH